VGKCIIYYADKQIKGEKDDNKNRWNTTGYLAICLLEKHLARVNRVKSNYNAVIEMGRISVELSDELEKKLRLKTIERFGGKKGDLSRAVEEAIKEWLAKK
jgi:hypothetical protein